MLVEVVQDLNNSLDKTLFDFCSVKENEFKFKCHRAHHFSRHGPIWGDRATKYTDHIEHFLDKVVRFDNIAQVNNVGLC